MKLLYYSILIVLFLIILTLIYINIRTEKFSDGGGNARLEYYSLSTCPHCVKFNPLWDKIASQCPESTVKYVVDQDNNGQMNANKYQIDSFPTIIVTADGKKKDELLNERTCTNIKTLCEKNGISCNITC